MRLGLVKSCQNCGHPIERARSPKHHRHTFALIKAAYEQWPKHHPFQPNDPEHLRAWLLVMIDYKTVKIVEPPHIASWENPNAMQAFVREILDSKKLDQFCTWNEGILSIYTPKSINWEKLSQEKFQLIATAIGEVIEIVIGITVAELLPEKEKA